jgi:hypothetical protein
MMDSLERGANPPRRGRLGWADAGELRVQADAARFYVRFPDESFAAALHRGRVPPLPDLPVLVGVEAWTGELAILGTDPTEIELFAGPEAGALDIGLHSHARFSGLEFAIDDRLWLKLAARPLAGLHIEITPGRYDADGTLRWWPGGSLDLAPYRPALPNHQAWCVVGLDPASASLVAVAGAAVSVVFPLLPAQIAAVPFNWAGQIALCAARLRYGQTALIEADFEALLATAAPAMSASLDRLLSDSAGDVLTDDNGDILYEG